MCLIFISYRSHAQYPLVVAANRDEFFARETQQAHLWDGGVLAGRDGRAGGTWLGVRKAEDGGVRFAALTNRRGGTVTEANRSRGELSANFLNGSASAADYAHAVAARADDYAGFNLLVADDEAMFYINNDSAAGSPNALEAGCYGLSNGVLEEPWPKLTSGKRRFEELLASPQRLETDALIHMMNDRSRPAPHELPSTGLSAELEHRLSSVFIENEPGSESLEDYGTLCSTALIVNSGGTLRFHERNFDRGGRAERSHFFHLG